jgi:hypothetical protein
MLGKLHMLSNSGIYSAAVSSGRNVAAGSSFLLCSTPVQYWNHLWVNVVLHVVAVRIIDIAARIIDIAAPTAFILRGVHRASCGVHRATLGA